MKKLLSLLLCGLFLFVTVCPALADEKNPLSFSAGTLDFGETVYKETVEGKEITLTNNGDSTVTFSDINITSNAKDSAFVVPQVLTAVLTELKPGKTQTYTVTPKADLTVGTYTEAFTVTSSQPAYSVSFTATVTVNKATPKVTTPVLEAEFGTYVSDLLLPPIDNGFFHWNGFIPRGLTVGSVGKNIHEWLDYTPPDQTNYETLKKLPVTVMVTLTVPTVNAVCGQSLADLKLPEGWFWNVKSPENKHPKFGTAKESATFFKNGDTASEEITVITSHDFSGYYKYDALGHWKVCVCGEKGEYAEHTFETCTLEAQAKTYQICTVCDYATAPADQPQDEPKEESPVKQFFNKISEFFRSVINWFKALL